jgi:hypothetical protein
MFNRKLNQEINELWDALSDLAQLTMKMARTNLDLAREVHAQDHRIQDLEVFLYEEDTEDDDETCHC